MKKKYILSIFSLLISCSTVNKNNIINNVSVESNNEIERVTKLKEKYKNEINKISEERLKEDKFVEIKENKNEIIFDVLREKSSNIKDDRTEILEDSKHNNFKYSDEKELIYVFESGLSETGIQSLSDINIPGVNIINKDELKNTLYNNIIHAKKVLESLIENKYADKSIIDVKLKTFYNNYDRIVAKGIINMSYGWSNYYQKLSQILKYKEYIDKIIEHNPDYIMERDIFSNLIFDEGYKENRQLKILALGNGELDSTFTRNYYNSADGILMYSKMSPELQKAARSESILVKNMYSDVEKKKDPSFSGKTVKIGNQNFYEVEYGDKNNSKPLLFRSATVVHEGYLNSGYRGSSFSAPKVTRLAYEIKNKYPFLTYHQVKEIILTTAKRNEDDYLSNIIGWGLVDGDRALEGFSDFNAGLIEETKFFEGMHEKIYDKKGNIYQYIDIPNGIYKFSNDIRSGLKGDGHNLSVDPPLILTDSSYHGEKKENFRFNVAKVLDSEKNYYSNVKQAGLRKAGKGELILSGKQDYPFTQILEGSLTLENTSNSKYDVFNDGILRLEKNAKIENEVNNDGMLVINTDVDIKRYISTDKAITKFKAGKKLKTEESFIGGKISVYFPEGKINSEYTLIEGEKIDLNKIEILNIFLPKPEINNKKVVKIGTGINKKLYELEKSELRNIPSYDYNKGKFFEEYNFDEPNPSLLNVVSNNREHTLSQIFTDNYGTYLYNVLNLNNIILSNLKNPVLRNISKDKSLYYNSFISTNLVNDGINTPFKNNIFSNSLGIDFKFDKDINIGTFGSISKLRNSFKSDADFLANKYGLGFKLKYKYKNLILSNVSSYSFIKTKINRKLVNDEINSKFNLHLLNNMSTLGYEINLGRQHKFIPNLDLILTRVLINSSKESVNGEHEKLGLEIKDNNLFFANLGFGLDWKYMINKHITLENEINLNINLKDKIELETKLLDKDMKMKGKNLDKFLMKYRIGANINLVDNFKINIDSSINTKGRWDNSFTFKYEF